MKARVWLDDFYLYIEFTNEGEVISHEQYGNVIPFTKEYVNNYITYLFGKCEVEFVD